MATVLLVEDNDDVREMMSLALQLSGNVVITASNGREALTILRDRPPPCVILLDLMMPVMDGRAFRDAQRHDAALADIPVIVVSADARGAEKAHQLGATASVSKPIDLDLLLELVRTHL